MTRKAWRDQLSIAVEFRSESQLGPLDEVWVFTTSGALDDADIPLDEILAFLKEDGVWPYYIERREGIRNWGASGAAETIILSLSTEAVSFALLEPAIRALMAKIQHRVQSRQESWEVTDDQAENRARWYAVERFELGVEPKALQLHAFERDLTTGAWTYEFDHDGHRYTVVLESAEGLTTFTKVRREVVT
jgi:hypothetical protein